MGPATGKGSMMMDQIDREVSGMDPNKFIKP